MKVAVIGSGGREHTLVWKISQSPKVKKIYAIPGNGGIDNLAELVPIDASDITNITEFCKNNKIDLVMIGPEAPLSKGLADMLRENNIPVVGANKQASFLESSKVWAKDLMIKYGIPTAKFELVNTKNDLMSAIDSFGIPVVIKMDGLCAGKGVFVCHTYKETEEAANTIYGSSESGHKVVLEQFLTGTEASYMVFSDGESYIPIATSRDHKKIFEKETGPNTGGMGAVSPAPIDDSISLKAEELVIKPLLKGLKEENISYNGVIYAGLMISPDNQINVLEFNARFGDPETQAILMRMESDIMDILLPLGKGTLPANYKIKWSPKIACCVVLAEQGYPGAFSKGAIIDTIKNLKAGKDEYIFHAGTVKNKNEYQVNGGRVLGVTALGSTLEEARTKAYSLTKKAAWKSAYYRKDIGYWE